MVRFIHQCTANLQESVDRQALDLVDHGVGGGTDACSPSRKIVGTISMDYLISGGEVLLLPSQS